MDAEAPETGLLHTVPLLSVLPEHVGDSDILPGVIHSSPSGELRGHHERRDHSSASGAQRGLVLVRKKMEEVTLILDLRVLNW